MRGWGRGKSLPSCLTRLYPSPLKIPSRVPIKTARRVFNEAQGLEPVRLLTGSSRTDMGLIGEGPK